jgi:hypothetical protein
MGLGTVSLTGSDTVVINGRVLHDFANGDVATLTFDGDLVKATPSKNGNVIYSLDVAGLMSKLELKLLLGSPDDRYINSLLAGQIRDLSTVVLASGSFVKRVGDGQGNVTNVIYNTLGGVVQKFPGAKINTSGDSEQSVAVWMFQFGNNSRALM